MEEVKITTKELLVMAKEALPKIIKDKFGSSYSNPLADAIGDVFKSEDFKSGLQAMILECYNELKDDLNLKVFIKESIVNKVISDLQKRN